MGEPVLGWEEDVHFAGDDDADGNGEIFYGNYDSDKEPRNDASDDELEIGDISALVEVANNLTLDDVFAILEQQTQSTPICCLSSKNLQPFGRSIIK